MKRKKLFIGLGVIVALLAIFFVLSMPEKPEPIASEKNTITYSALSLSGIRDAVVDISDEKALIRYNLPDSINQTAAVESITKAVTEVAPETKEIVIETYKNFKPVDKKKIKTEYAIDSYKGGISEKERVPDIRQTFADKGIDIDELVGRLNETLLDQTSPITTLLSDVMETPLIMQMLPKAGKWIANIQILATDTTTPLAVTTVTFIVTTEEDIQIKDISKGTSEDAKANIYVEENVLVAILDAQTAEESTNLVMNAIKVGKVKFTGTDLASTILPEAAQRIAIIYSKLTPSEFDVKKGEKRTITFRGTEATLEQNALGQKIISFEDLDVVVSVSENGDILGVSTTGTQMLIDADPAGLSSDAGYYGSDYVPPTPIFAEVVKEDEEPVVVPTTKEPLWSYEIPAMYGGFSDFREVAISSDGKYIVAGTCNYETGKGRLYLFSRTSSTPLWNYDSSNCLSNVDISLDGNWIVAGAWYEHRVTPSIPEIYLFHKDSSTPKWSYDAGPVDPLFVLSNVKTFVAIDPTGKAVAANALEDLYLFRIESPIPFVWGPVKTGTTQSIDIASSGDVIVGGRWGGPVSLYGGKSITNPLLWSYEATHDKVVSISSDGSYIAAGTDSLLNPQLLLFSSSSSTPLWSYKTDPLDPEALKSVAMSSDGNYIAAGSHNLVYLFSRTSSTPLWETNQNPESREWLISISISSDGSYIAAGFSDSLSLFSKDSSTPLWSYQTGVESVAISSDGKYVAAGGRDSKIYLFSLD